MIFCTDSFHVLGAPIDEYPDEAFQKVVNLNLNRVFSLIQA
jgi:NAD(P)-dependent dehydrogenase (short-subunit alcohol dehydrogenase family)